MATRNNPIDNKYGHLQPQALDAEAVVLGALLIDRTAYNAIKHVITVDTFYDTKNKKVFKAIKELADNDAPIDIITVNNQLEKDGSLNEVGGPTYVVELSHHVASSANIEYHAKIIAEKQLQRLAILIAHSAEEKAYDNSNDIYEELRKFQASIEQLTAAANNKFEDDYEPISLAQVIEEEKMEPDGIETQYWVHDRDDNCYNLEIPAKQLTLIGAQTSHGKSRLLENLTVYAVDKAQEDEVILYYTFEESRNMVFEEMLSIYTSIAPLSKGRNIDTIRKHLKGNDNFVNSTADLNKFQALAKQFDHKQHSHLRIINKPYCVEEIIDNIKFLNSKFTQNGRKIKAIFVDYVQLIRRQQETGNTKVDISYVMRKLQDFAVLDVKLPIILAAQLNRQAGSPLDLHNQNMADASDIEHNASLVIMEWNSSFKPLNGSSWDKPENRSERERLLAEHFEPGKPGKMYLLVTKWRGGPRGSEAILEFDQNTGLIWGNEQLKKQKEENDNIYEFSK